MIAPTLNAYSGRNQVEGQYTTGPLGGGNDGIGRRTADDPNLVMQCHGSSVGPMGALRQGNGGLTGGVPFVAHTLSAEGHDASEDGTGRGTPLVAMEMADTLGVGANQTTGFLGDLGPAVGNMVRRLTPVECERLQGFPDGWTCLCTPLAAYQADPDAAALACICPDSPRYRALGNAVTVSVVSYLGERLREVM